MSETGAVVEKSLRSVFVGNIPYEATEEKLKDIFNQVGPVVSFKLMHDRESGKPRGYGFCEYKDQETALSAMRNLNGFEIGGRPLRVDNACTEKSRMEMQSLMMGPVVESPYGPDVEPSQAPEAISNAVASLPPEQMFELMRQMQVCVRSNRTEARTMLLNNPQLAYALLQAQVVMRIIDPKTAVQLLHGEAGSGSVNAKSEPPHASNGPSKVSPPVSTATSNGVPPPSSGGPPLFGGPHPPTGPPMQGPPSGQSHLPPHQGPPHQGPPHQGPPHQGPPHQGPPHQGPPHQGPPHQGPPHQGPPHQGPPHQGPPHQGPPHQGPPHQGPPHQGPPHQGPPHQGPPHQGPPHQGPPHQGPPHQGPPHQGPPHQGPPHQGPPHQGPPPPGPHHHGGPPHMSGPPPHHMGGPQGMQGPPGGPPFGGGGGDFDLRGPPPSRGSDQDMRMGQPPRGHPMDFPPQHHGDFDNRYGRDGRGGDMDQREPRFMDQPPPFPPRDARDSNRLDQRDPRARDEPRGGPDRDFRAPPPDQVRDPRGRGGPPEDFSRGPPTSNAGPPSGLPSNLTSGLAGHDQEKASLIMQVLQLSDEQIRMLPPEQQASILQLKEQIQQSQH